MTSKRTDLEVNVTANASQARNELGDVADAARRLEDGVEVGVEVDDQASDELRDIRAKLDGLSDRDREIALRATADQLEREIGRAERALGRLDRYDNEEIQIRLDARDNATRKLDAVQAEIRALDGEEVDIRVDATGADDVRGAFGDLTGGATGGVVLAAGKAGMIGAAVAGAVELGNRFADAAIQAQAIADAFQVSLEDASRLLTVFGRQGFEFDDVFDLLSQFNQAITESPELAEKLKLDPNDTLIDQFLDAVTNLQTEVDTVGERGVIAAQLFGEEGDRQIKLIQATVGDLRTQIENVPAISVISQDDVDKSREFKENVNDLRAYMEGAAVQAGWLVGALNTVLSNSNRNPLETIPGALTSGAIDQVFGSGRPQSPVVTGATPIDPQTYGQLGGFGPYLPGQGPGQMVIINPPGTPTATVEQQRLYNQRNGLDR